MRVKVKRNQNADAVGVQQEDGSLLITFTWPDGSSGINAWAVDGYDGPYITFFRYLE